MKKVLIAGAGGFIGGHLEKFLKKKGYWIRCVDIKKPEYEDSVANEFLLLDLREEKNALIATKGVDYVYNLAANMGGMGFISTSNADILHDNVLIDTNMLHASNKNNVKRFFYPSSALVYPNTITRIGFKEEDAYPANPDSEYGWEKLFSERLCNSYSQEKGLETRIARFHNIYGPKGTWMGGRERVVAAICRKIAEVSDDREIEVWGDGKQTRSFCYIDDCVNGIYKLMMSNVDFPINIGSSQLITVDQLVKMTAKIANKKIKINHDISKPQGVRSRNSDNKIIKKFLKWEPSISLEVGLKETYSWVRKQVEKRKKIKKI